jgi:prephenate dehydrogenase
MTAGRSSADGPGLPAATLRGDAANRRAAAASLPDRIAFVGLGLIGGSIAKALRDVESTSRLAAWSPAGRGPEEGLRLGLVDDPAAALDGALDGAGLVILAGPPLAVLDGLDAVADARRRGILAADATITDVASTKARIVARAAELGLPFVGGHPMAGREASGVGAADGDLFVDAPWVVVPAPDARDADVVHATALAWAAGARPIQMTADAHDRAVAAISHLPLVVAAALVEAVTGAADWPTAESLAATGWRDMTRLARGDAEMGAGILATNAAAVADRLRDLRAVLDGWIEALDRAGDADAAAFRGRLDTARRAIDPEMRP